MKGGRHRGPGRGRCRHAFAARLARRSGLVAAITCAALLTPRPAGHATVGGPRSLEVIGYAPVDAKVYLLQHDHGGSGDLPRVLYYTVAANGVVQPAAAPTPVTSWYDGDVREAEAAFPERLEWLRERTVPLREASTRDVWLTSRHVDYHRCPSQQDAPSADDVAWAVAQARAASRAGSWYREARGDSAPAALVHVCEQREVLVRWGEHVGTMSVSTWGDVELASAWQVPDTNLRLVVVRHQAITFETGYMEDEPLMLRDVLPRLP